jgi:hypothetical protein
MPEGSVEDDSDLDGGMPEDQECPKLDDNLRSRTESLPDDD